VYRRSWSSAAAQSSQQAERRLRSSLSTRIRTICDASLHKHKHKQLRLVTLHDRLTEKFIEIVCCVLQVLFVPGLLSFILFTKFEHFSSACREEK